MKLSKVKKGYTLVELLVSTGVLSIAAIGTYAIAMIASDWRKASQEVRALNMLMVEIDNSTNTTGSYEGISMTSLNQYATGFNSELELSTIVSPNATKLNFIYKDMNSRICSDFTSKMLSSSNNVETIINGKEISDMNLVDIVSACEISGGLSDVTIVLNKNHGEYTIDNIVASINPPEPPHSDVEIPTFGPPKVPPIIPDFIPNTADIITYPITTDTPPTFGPIVGGGGPIDVNSPPQIAPILPGTPGWTPPNVNKPPSTPAPPDDIDQNPNPPPPPPKPALPPEPPVIVPPGTAPPGQVGGVGELKVNIAWAGNEDVDFALWDPQGAGYGYFAVGHSSGCRGKACWDLDNKGSINAPGDKFNRQENVYYPSNPPLGKYTITMYRFRGRPVNNLRISVTAVIGGKGINQAVYMPAGFNSFPTDTPYPVRVIIELHHDRFDLYLQ